MPQAGSQKLVQLVPLHAPIRSKQHHSSCCHAIKATTTAASRPGHFRQRTDAERGRPVAPPVSRWLHMHFSNTEWHLGPSLLCTPHPFTATTHCYLRGIELSQQLRSQVRERAQDAVAGGYSAVIPGSVEQMQLRHPPDSSSFTPLMGAPKPACTS